MQITGLLSTSNTDPHPRSPRPRKPVPNESKKLSAVKATALSVKDLTLHRTFNRSNTEKLTWFQTEYTDAIAHNLKMGGDNSGMSCEVCIRGKARREPFKSLSSNRYAPLDAVSSDTIFSLAQKYLDGNNYLQLLADNSTGHLTGLQ